jgi:hypothetical protein
MDKIKASDSYVALLYGTMAAAMLAGVFYIVQPKKDGKLAFPHFKTLLRLISTDPNTEYDYAVPLMTVKDSVESFVFGMAKVFRALVVLTLAWGIASVMSDVGTDRFIGRIITEELSPKSLPTISYITSALISLCIGTSWGTMGIVFPLTIVPTYEASGGDPRLVYATVAGILAGSITGDHASIISDTTVLSTLACECDLVKHVKTQFPYVGVVALWSVLVGTIPIGYHDNYPNGVAIFLGLVFIVVSIMLLGVPAVSETGKYDIGTELYIKIFKNQELIQLKEDTKKAYSSDGVKEELVEKEAEDDKDVEEAVGVEQPVEGKE